MQVSVSRLTMLLLALYLAVFPGATLTVALDRVPVWGAWMGGALLILQGTIVLCWLISSYGRWGVLAASLIASLAWAIEHIGVTTGFPFGRYSYTAALQPQIFGVVPLAIVCAWLMVAVGAWQLAGALSAGAGGRAHRPGSGLRSHLLAATLVMLLDLQIEPVATAINRYWVWGQDGWYYGVPASNFAAWWVVGALLTLVVARVLSPFEPGMAARAGAWQTPLPIARLLAAAPMGLYLLSTLMFTVITLMHGYLPSGLVGVVVLLWAIVRGCSRAGRAASAAGHR